LCILHLMHQAEVRDMGLWAARADEVVALKNIDSTFFAPKLSFGTHDHPYCLNVLWPSIKHSCSQVRVTTYRNTIGYSNPSPRHKWNLPPYVQVSEILCPLPFHCVLGQQSHCSDSLQARWSGDWIPVRARFSTPVWTGPGAHPFSCTMATGSLSQG
jgi:hypothetical protein